MRSIFAAALLAASALSIKLQIPDMEAKEIRKLAKSADKHDKARLQAWCDESDSNHAKCEDAYDMAKEALDGELAQLPKRLAQVPDLSKK